MKPRPSDLWRLRGTLDRGPYAFWAVALAVLKYNVDRIVVSTSAGKVVSPLSYWVPGDVFGVLPLSDDRARAPLLLLLIALPFVWSGIALTLRRARAAGMPAWTVLLFFIPVVNLILFAVLCVLPTRGSPMGIRKTRFLDRVVPESALGSAAMALLLVVPIGGGLSVLSTNVLENYGWGLFVGLPFFLGLASSLIHGYHRPRSVWSCLAVSTMAMAFLAFLLIAVAVEGAICILMAFPIAAILGIFGAFVGYVIQWRPGGGRDAGVVVPSLVLLLPGIFGAESAAQREPPVLEVRSALEVDAPPERVWKHVVAFAELPPPREMLFRLGVAYPLRAEIDGCGPGAVRHCVFSTGPFVEPIEVWDEPRLLEFSVFSQPPSMRELSPYPALAPAHLEHHLVSRRGRFRIEPLEGGRTRLEGTTWYTNRMWPSVYWRIWSDEVIHRIHLHAC